MIKKDCSGLPCPQPVLEARELVASHPSEPIEIIVDNEPAVQNVSRFLQSQGYDVESHAAEQEGRYVINGVPGACAIAANTSPDDAGAGAQKILVFIPSDTLGTGDDELGRKLMRNFIMTLGELGPDLWRVVFVNSGVKLAVNGSENLDALKELETRGVSILVCGTCLDYFGLVESRAVGETTNMLDIVTSMQLASKVIRC